MFPKKVIFICLILFAFFNVDCKNNIPGEGNRDSQFTFFGSPQKGKLPYFRGKDLESFWAEHGKIPIEARKVDSFKFTNQSDVSFGHDNLKNKITIVSFFFAKCHGICPNIIRNLKFVQSTYGNDRSVQIVSYSVTPDLDTPAELRKLANEKGMMDGKWTLLTGERDRIHSFARNVFQADTTTTNKNPNDFVHSEQIFLIDKNLHFRGVYNGNKGDSVKTMIGDIKILEKEG
ncbi:MAG: SCO family protein, partial [Leptospira sp.]|nr:SCO family protein [Leptospira sp.]